MFAQKLMKNRAAARARQAIQDRRAEGIRRESTDEYTQAVYRALVHMPYGY